MPDDVRRKGEDGLGQFGPALFACKALPFVSCKKKMLMPHCIKYATSWVNLGKMRSDDPNLVQPKRQRILNEKGEEIAEMEFKYMGGSALF